MVLELCYDYVTGTITELVQLSSSDSISNYYYCSSSSELLKDESEL